MTKVTYASLKLKTNNEIKTFDFNGNKIEVLQYLPIEDKYSLLNISLEQSKDGEIFNPLKEDMYFHLNLVFMYSNLSFTEKQKEDYPKLYDTLQSSGLLGLILENIPEEEYSLLFSYLKELENNYIEYKSTISSFATQLLNEIPNQIENLQKILNDFDIDKFTELKNFTKAINGGKDIV